MSSARAIQRSARQSPYKMRLVIDQIRGLNVNEALALLSFSKKHAAVQIKKVLVSAVANAEQAARRDNAGLDVDTRGVLSAAPLRCLIAATAGSSESACSSLPIRSSASA